MSLSLSLGIEVSQPPARPKTVRHPVHRHLSSSCPSCPFSHHKLLHHHPVMTLEELKSSRNHSELKPWVCFSPELQLNLPPPPFFAFFFCKVSQHLPNNFSGSCSVDFAAAMRVLVSSARLCHNLSLWQEDGSRLADLRPSTATSGQRPQLVQVV